MKKSDKNEKLCNCTSKINFPVDNKCCLNFVIYKAKVSTSENDHTILNRINQKECLNLGIINTRPLLPNLFKANQKIYPICKPPMGFKQ